MFNGDKKRTPSSDSNDRSRNRSKNQDRSETSQERRARLERENTRNLRTVTPHDTSSLPEPLSPRGRHLSSGESSIAKRSKQEELTHQRLIENYQQSYRLLNETSRYLPTEVIQAIHQVDTDRLVNHISETSIERPTSTSSDHPHYTPGTLRELLNDPTEIKTRKHESIKEEFKVDKENDVFAYINDTLKEIDDYIEDAAHDLDRLIERSQNLLKESTLDTRRLPTRGLLDARQRLIENLNGIEKFQNELEEYKEQRKSLQDECNEILKKYQKDAENHESDMEHKYRSEHNQLGGEQFHNQKDYLDLKKDLQQKQKSLQEIRDEHQEEQRNYWEAQRNLKDRLITENIFKDIEDEFTILQYKLRQEETTFKHEKATFETEEREYLDRRREYKGKQRESNIQKYKKIDEIKKQYLRNFSNIRRHYILKEYDLSIKRCSEQELHTDNLRNTYIDLSQVNRRIEQYQETIANIRDDNLRQYLSNSENEVATAIDNLVTFSRHFRNPSEREGRTIQNIERQLNEVLLTAQRAPVNLRESLDGLSTISQELERLIQNRAEAESKKKGKEKAD
jgi:hypothetical protein